MRSYPRIYGKHRPKPPQYLSMAGRRASTAVWTDRGKVIYLHMVYRVLLIAKDSVVVVAYTIATRHVSYNSPREEIRGASVSSIF